MERGRVHRAIQANRTRHGRYGPLPTTTIVTWRATRAKAEEGTPLLPTAKRAPSSLLEPYVSQPCFGLPHAYLRRRCQCLQIVDYDSQLVLSGGQIIRRFKPKQEAYPFLDGPKSRSMLVFRRFPQDVVVLSHPGVFGIVEAQRYGVVPGQAPMPSSTTCLRREIRSDPHPNSLVRPRCFCRAPARLPPG